MRYKCKLGYKSCNILLIIFIYVVNSTCKIHTNEYKIYGICISKTEDVNMKTWNLCCRKMLKDMDFGYAKFTRITNVYVNILVWLTNFFNQFSFEKHNFFL